MSVSKAKTKAWIRLIEFDCSHHPLRATVVTPYGIARCRWQKVGDKWSSVKRGSRRAIDEASVAFEHIGYMADDVG